MHGLYDRTKNDVNYSLNVVLVLCSIYVINDKCHDDIGKVNIKFKLQVVLAILNVMDP